MESGKRERKKVNNEGLRGVQLIRGEKQAWVREKRSGWYCKIVKREIQKTNTLGTKLKMRMEEFAGSRHGLRKMLQREWGEKED